VRLDKFLQVSRLIKRRAVANRLCDHGRVRVNGAPAKPSATIHPGDVITISQGDRRVVAKVVSDAQAEILARTTVEEWHA